jgi:hypothetical protein
MSKIRSNLRPSQLATFALAASVAVHTNNAAAGFGLGDIVDPLHVVPGVPHSNPPPVVPPPVVVPPVVPPFVPPSVVPAPIRSLQQQLDKSGQDVQRTAEKAGNDVITTVVKANNDT